MTTHEKEPAMAPDAPVKQQPEMPPEVKAAMDGEASRLQQEVHSYLQSRVVELAVDNARLQSDLLAAHDAYEQLSRLVTKDTPEGDTPVAQTSGEGEI